MYFPAGIPVTLKFLIVPTSTFHRDPQFSITYIEWLNDVFGVMNTQTLEAGRVSEVTLPVTLKRRIPGVTLNTPQGWFSIHSLNLS